MLSSPVMPHAEHGTLPSDNTKRNFRTLFFTVNNNKESISKFEIQKEYFWKTGFI